MGTVFFMMVIFGFLVGGFIPLIGPLVFAFVLMNVTGGRLGYNDWVPQIGALIGILLVSLFASRMMESYFLLIANPFVYIVTIGAVAGVYRWQRNKMRLHMLQSKNII